MNKIKKKKKEKKEDECENRKGGGMKYVYFRCEHGLIISFLVVELFPKGRFKAVVVACDHGSIR